MADIRRTPGDALPNALPIGSMAMSVLAGPFFAVAGLLGAAGAAKVVRPASTVEALRVARLAPSASLDRALDRPVVGRSIGLVELTIATAALLLGGRVPAAIVAASYVAFALFTARLLHTAGAGASCGCFGAATTPATSLHVAVNVGIAAVAALAVAWPITGLRDVLSHQPLAGLPFLVVAAVLGWLVFAALTALPDLHSAMTGPSGASAAPVRRR